MGYLTEIHIQLIRTLPNDEYYKLALIVGDRESLADTFDISHTDHAGLPRLGRLDHTRCVTCRCKPRLHIGSYSLLLSQVLMTILCHDLGNCAFILSRRAITKQMQF